jgi:L-lactate dehydrogenase complex protein LldE
MKITLFVPCYVDSFYPKAAWSVVRILEKLGHSVEVPQSITCCGQPPFNSGYWDQARPVAAQVLQALDGAEAVVVPSGSCATMIKVFYPQLFAGKSEEDAANQLAERVWEFSEFLVNKLDITDVGARFPHRATWHDGCHGLRELHVKSQPRQLLDNVKGLELVEMGEAQTCCGFGGAFAVKYADISRAMGEVKLDSAKATGAEYLISNDSSCMMHLQGLAARRKQKLKCLHLAEVLASE